MRGGAAAGNGAVARGKGPALGIVRRHLEGCVSWQRRGCRWQQRGWARNGGTKRRQWGNSERIQSGVRQAPRVRGGWAGKHGRLAVQGAGREQSRRPPVRRKHGTNPRSGGVTAGIGGAASFELRKLGLSWKGRQAGRWEGNRREQLSRRARGSRLHAGRWAGGRAGSRGRGRHACKPA